MNVDIICPLYNAQKYINKLHFSINNQKEVNIKEIKYILTKGNDKTQEQLKALNANYVVIEKEEFSHSLTRQKIGYESNADILVFITQDIIIEDELWLHNLIKDIENGKCEAAYSRQICNNNSIEKYTREINYPDKSQYKTKEQIGEFQLQTFFFSDASSAIRRDKFIEVNGYDDKDLPTNEDMYIAYKLIMKGYTIKYCADSIVIHSHDFTLKELFNRYYITGKFFKCNKNFNKYRVNNSGLNMAKYILKRALQEKNLKVLIRFLPDMAIRFIAMKLGKVL
ncbi:MAG: glycosyltransferase [Clostridia bacterium]|nr:glycosyltransferase [Clostridia bacterium]